MTVYRTVLMALFLAVFTLAVGSRAAAQEASVSVVVDASEQGSEINPFIYAQFIEHLGRCIYGGIWAEMLEDRKFYFPIDENYDPYKSLQDSDFPVVGASPWQIIGDAGQVTMVEADSFVGEQTPRIAPEGGIRQLDLGVVEGKRYQGYVWLKADGAAGQVSVALICGDGAARQQTAIDGVGEQYQKFEFEFTADASSDHASLELAVGGGSPVLVGTLSLMPADNVNGMRPDTLELLKQLDAPMYRWPGGNFVSGYNWRDGIGPRDRRPPRKNPAWTGVEHNDVGIDEFIAFCREVNAEPMIAANTGFGDAYSAAQEVEYCNGSTDTIGGGWRAKNGNQEPFQVKYWCVGNEMFGRWQLGYMALNQYTLKHNEVADAMWDADSSIELVGVGEYQGDRPPPQNQGNQGRRGRPQRGWSTGMLEDSADKMDYISEHFYRRRHSDNVPDHIAQMVDSIRAKADGHRQLQARLELLPDRKVPIAMDEWNYWYQPYEYGELGCVYDLQDALGIAAGLHEYFRNSDIIQMAHYAQTVNVIGCIKTTKTEAFLDSTALPLMIYRRHFGNTPLGVTIDGDAHDVDVSAALTDDGSALTIGVVNPNAGAMTVAVKTDGLDLASRGQHWTVAGDDPRAHNDVDNENVAVQDGVVEFNGELTVPGYGFTVVRIPVENN